ncbi:GNAT family N-acetyltransferase [Loktanella salsilacus]|uniref:GNAT family N-acetyltransferase n=1 Tax=Loktanella salsilacus TaxID=195913 RepID=UPI0020B6A2E9|nr:GNAT family N-acetyltransferase [Loktanella salsilacus]
MIIAPGIPAGQTEQAAALYWDAFGPKLGRVLGPAPRALHFIAGVIDPSHVISATNEAGHLIGIAGFKTHRGAFVGGTLRDLARHYGWPGALWRSALLSLLSRDTENLNFLTDGLAVAAPARSQGVGTALLDALSIEARSRNYPALRLDVVDTNPRARALYARLGFIETKTTQIGPLRHIFNFRRTITMVRPV